MAGPAGHARPAPNFIRHLYALCAGLSPISAPSSYPRPTSDDEMAGSAWTGPLATPQVAASFPSRHANDDKHIPIARHCPPFPPLSDGWLCVDLPIVEAPRFLRHGTIRRRRDPMGSFMYNDMDRMVFMRVR